MAKTVAKKLTKRVADAARAVGAERFLWDPELPGFGLRVRLSGRRYYVIQYRSKGRTRRLTLGPHGALTPDRARRKAAKLLAEAHDGGDPAVTIRSVAHSITVGDLAKRFIAQHAELKKKPTSVRNDLVLRCKTRIAALTPTIPRISLVDTRRPSAVDGSHGLSTGAPCGGGALVAQLV